jgi:hypothetical protein
MTIRSADFAETSRRYPVEERLIYRNTAENNDPNTSQIASHRASDKTMTPISCAARGSAECDRVLLPSLAIGQFPFGVEARLANMLTLTLSRCAIIHLAVSKK